MEPKYFDLRGETLSIITVPSDKLRNNDKKKEKVNTK